MNGKRKNVEVVMGSMGLALNYVLVTGTRTLHFPSRMASFTVMLWLSVYSVSEQSKAQKTNSGLLEEQDRCGLSVNQFLDKLFVHNYMVSETKNYRCCSTGLVVECRDG